MTATRLMLSAALLLPCCSTLAQTDTDSGNYMLQHCNAMVHDEYIRVYSGIARA